MRAHATPTPRPNRRTTRPGLPPVEVLTDIACPFERAATVGTYVGLDHTLPTPLARIRVAALLDCHALYPDFTLREIADRVGGLSPTRVWQLLNSTLADKIRAERAAQPDRK